MDRNKKIIKHISCYVAVTLLSTLTVSFAVAATVTSSSYDESVSVSWQQIQEYRQRSNDLQQKINALSTIANASVLMPVLFGVEVEDISPNFGDPRSGGRTHEGEDIMAVKGTPIVSPTPAVVIRTDYGTGEGNAVYTANPGGETFIYYHLDRFGEGVVSGLVLKQGSLIGYVGNTGNASGGAAHLHFEIHNSSGVPIDPFPRLTGEFSLQEKISYLSTILTQTSDSVALSKFLVTNFRSTFISALAAKIVLSLPIIDALASISEGALIRAIGDIDVYIVKYINGKKFKRLILSPTVFNSYKDLRWKDVMDVTPEIVNTFTTSDLVRATAVGDPKVYKLYPSGDTGEKRWIKTQEAFIRLGYDWDAIYTINVTDRNSYIEKEAIE